MGTSSHSRDPMVAEVLKLLPGLSKALSQSMPEDARREGVSVAQVRVLVHLNEYGPQTMGALAEGLRITTPSATGLINPLVEMGYVVRERSERDRRVVTVELSAHAHELAESILAQQRSDVEEALGGMDTTAQSNFLEGLTRLAATFGAKAKGGRRGVAS
jgi:DNA-binding MarR family transcriptional regulator